MTSTKPSIDHCADRKQRQIKVAIIGAGLSGLSVANGLLNDPSNRFDVQVYERDTIAFDSERGGYQVRISSNGLAALKFIADPELWASLREVWQGDDAQAPAVVDPATFDIQLRLADLKLYPKSRPVSRQLLRHALLQPLLTSGRVHLSHQFSSFALKQDGGVRLHFHDQASQDADILIAADGSGSQVNRQVGLNNKVKLKDWVLLQSRGCIDKATRDQLPRSLLDAGSVMVMGGRELSGFASIYAPRKEDLGTESSGTYTLFWSAVVPTARGEEMLRLAGDDPKDVIPLFVDYLRNDLGYGEAFPTIVQAATDLPRTGLVSSSVRPKEDWRRGIEANARIILLGDAVHPMTPGRGMGANQALTDAGNLVRLLTTATFGQQVPSDGELADLVREFDAEMYPRAFKMVKASEDIVGLDLTKTSGKWLVMCVGVVLTVLGWGVSVLEAVGLMTLDAGL